MDWLQEDLNPGPAKHTRLLYTALRENQIPLLDRLHSSVAPAWYERWMNLSEVEDQTKRQ
eukprot:4519880-Amphidinium_carterae.1